jgi:ketosteroid isomerase-like protein
LRETVSLTARVAAGSAASATSRRDFMHRRMLLLATTALSLSLGAQDTSATKAALLAADRAAAASAEALTRALSADATVLVPDAPVLTGRAAYLPAVAAMTAAPAGGVAWTPIHAIVSRSGDFGCTTGVLHLPAPDTAHPITGRYANCWRLENGVWVLIVHSRSHAPATVRTLPESLPGAPGSSGSASPQPAGAARAMDAADRAFAKVSVDSGGPGRAFSAWIAEDGMMLGGRAAPPRGPDGARAAFAGFPATGRMEWGPIDGLARASREGDLGYTIGEARIAATPTAVGYSKYLTVWRRNTDGAYRFVFDIGSDRPAPDK